MRIQVKKGIGTGPTELAAFDQALVSAGDANYNLIYLSSVLPPDSDVTTDDNSPTMVGTWGDRLYVVMAQSRTTMPGHEAWAGIGWIQDKATKKGLLVEHEGFAEKTVKSDIENSLDGLAANRAIDFGEKHMVMAGVKCEGKPVCALVVAVFESAAWEAASPVNIPKLKSFIKKMSAKSGN